MALDPALAGFPSGPYVKPFAADTSITRPSGSLYCWVKDPPKPPVCFPLLTSNDCVKAPVDDAPKLPKGEFELKSWAWELAAEAPNPLGPKWLELALALAWDCDEPNPLKLCPKPGGNLKVKSPYYNHYQSKSYNLLSLWSEKRELPNTTNLLLLFIWSDVQNRIDNHLIDSHITIWKQTKITLTF